MKQHLLAAILVVSSVISASAALYPSGTLDIAIPDDGNLYSTSITVPDTFVIGDVNVILNLSGGYNPDLYAYLSYNSTTVVLLNRINVTTANANGLPGAGMNVTLSDGATDIHNAGAGVLSGTYGPDGRAISPLSTGVQFDAASRQNSGNPLALYNGMNPNGTWTLYYGDYSGGEVSTLNSWALDIAPVPEPAEWGLISALGLFGICGLHAWRQKRSAKALAN